MLQLLSYFNINSNCFILCEKNYILEKLWAVKFYIVVNSHLHKAFMEKE